MEPKKEIVSLLQKATSLKDIPLETPPSPELGDYAFPCFILSKKLKTSPIEIAQQLSSEIKPSHYIEKIQANGPYLNFFINKQEFSTFIIKKILKEKNLYGASNLGKGKKVLVEHTSLNPNASPHVGRARNAILGDSIVRILKFQKYNPEVHYFINDVGKQVALLVLATQHNTTFDQLLSLYIKINKEMEKNPEIENKAFELLNKLEKGNSEVRKKFEKTVKICIQGQLKILKELGINYDKFDYESKYLWDKTTEKILNSLEKTGKLFTDEHNRRVLDQSNLNLPMETPYLVLTRKDSTSLYPLRDLAYTIDKIKQSKLNLIILGEEQKLYFQQIKAALKLLNYQAPEVIHYSFINLTEGRMSTRKGNLILLTDFMNEAVKKAEQEIKKRHPQNKNIKPLAKKIAYGAIKYTILKVSPDKNITFSWEEALNFEGDSSPYIQYTHARASSILRKEQPKTYKLLIKEKEELEIVKLLSIFPETVDEATKKFQPHIIANYLFRLSKSFNEFYHQHQVLKAETQIKNSRLNLVLATKQVLKNGLSLLGIDAIESM